MNIYAGNLAQSVTEETLNALFAQYGVVTSAKIMKDKFTGAHRGFGFLEMPNDEEAQKAIDALNGFELEGERLKINRAYPREQREFTPRQGGFGSGRPAGSGYQGGSGSSQGGYGRPRSGGSGYNGGGSSSRSSSGPRSGGFGGGSPRGGGFRGGNDQFE
jgi:RNA recognition motif-containing protein